MTSEALFVNILLIFIVMLIIATDEDEHNKRH